jgi:hypothetical protein
MGEMEEILRHILCHAEQKAHASIRHVKYRSLVASRIGIESLNEGMIIGNVILI